MNCERVQCLIGVHEELDAPTLRLLKDHISTCDECREAWLAEVEFRRLMAARPEAPAVSGPRLAAWLAIPAQSYKLLAAKMLIGKLGVPLLIAGVFATGAVYVAVSGPPGGQWTRDEPQVVKSGEEVGPAAGVRASGERQSVSAREDSQGILGGPTSLAAAQGSATRAATEELSDGSTGAGPGSERLRQPELAATQLARLAPTVSAPGRPASAAPTADALTPPDSAAATQTYVEPPTSVPPTSVPPTEKSVPDSTNVPSQPAPSLAPATASREATEVPATAEVGPTSVAASTATPSAAVTRTLVIEAWADLVGGSDPTCPGCDGEVDDRDAAAAADTPLGGVLVEVQSLADGERVPLFEGYLGHEGDGVHRSRVETTLPGPYEITLLGALDGYKLCPFDRPQKVIELTESAGDTTVVTFHLWIGCVPPTLTPAASDPPATAHPPTSPNRAE